MAGLVARIVALSYPSPVERARSQARDEHVRGGEEPFERGAVGRFGQIEHGPPLPDRRFRQNRRHLLEATRIDPQHIGAVGGQEPGRDRPGDDAGEVKNAEPAIRPGVGDRQRPRRGGRPRLDPRHRFGGARNSGRRRDPRRPVVHRRRTAADVDDRRLEFAPAPPRHLVGDGRPLVTAAAENLLRRRAVIAVVGVQPDPAVGGGVVAGDRIPYRRAFPAVRTKEDLADERRRRGTAINTDASDGRVVARRLEARGGQRRDRDRGRREAGHVEDRRQDVILADDRDRFQVSRAGDPTVADRASARRARVPRQCPSRCLT